jgi:NAD(P)-dependent dehydrogenase (short-subunit alcohol dehydrogenase family)
MGDAGMRLTGKAAIVTGAGRGIGRAIALALAREGCAVTLASRTRVELEAVADEVVGLGARSLPFTADVSAEAEAARLVEETLRAFGRVDILVNNAGISIPFRRVVDLPGKIVNLGSLSSFVGFAGNSAYGASKAGIVMFTKCLAAEVKAYGIDVNAVCPSGTDTRLLEEIGLKAGRTNLIRPEEIAALVLFLVTAEASAVTGTAIEAYGQSNPLFSGSHPSKAEDQTR